MPAETEPVAAQPGHVLIGHVRRPRGEGGERQQGDGEDVAHGEEIFSGFGRRAGDEAGATE